MSIHNRNLQEGTQEVLVETKFQTFFAKLYCLVFGHVVYKFKTPKIERDYCVCCWKEME